MKILIAGCGRVGLTLAQQLSAEGNDLTLMDSDPRVLESGVERYDVMAVQGNCASMQILRQAGVENADLLIACTGSDELNLLCCMTAHVVNPHLHTIARIRNPEYAEQAYMMRDAFALSMAFNPEQQAAVEIDRLLKFPGFLKRDSFAKGRLEIVEIRIDDESKLCNVPLSILYSIVKCRVLVCAVLRDGVAVTPNGKFTLQEGDRVFVTASSTNLAMLLKSLGLVRHKVRRALIAGGGTVTYYLAELLRESSVEVTVIESDEERCKEMSAEFPFINVICGDAREQSLLESEGIDHTDALIALTSNDELNMVISLYGHSREIKQTITKLEYLDESVMTGELPLGSVISPHRSCCNNIVRYVRSMQSQSGAAISVHSIADGQAEALEFRIDADTPYCDVPLKRIKLKKNVLLVGISHGSQTQIPNGESTYGPGDTVVVVACGDTSVRQFDDIFAF